MIYRTLENIDNSKYHSLFLRHAERFSLGNLINALSVKLTQKGKKDSYELGKHITFPEPIKLYHSPVERCKETIDNIKKGLDSKKIINFYKGQLFDLGGPFVTGPWEDMVTEINKHGFDTFIRKWFDGEISKEIVMPIEEAAYTQLNILINQLKKNDATYINVSHDWNLMLIREYFLRLKHEEIGLPGFLDGVISFLDNDKINLVYLNKTYSIST